MESKPPLSKGELQIARVLWQRGESTVREVHQALPDSKAMEFATVQTYLRRLEQKGYATAKLVGRTRHYRVRVRPKTVIRQTVGDLVDQLFDGEVMPLVRHLVEDRSINPDDLAELRAMIDKLDEDGSVRRKSSREGEDR